MQANTVAEARRLCAYMEEVAAAAAAVSYQHSPLRHRLAQQGVPWDPALLDEVRPSWLREGVGGCCPGVLRAAPTSSAQGCCGQHLPPMRGAAPS